MVETYQQQLRSRPAGQQDLRIRATPQAFGSQIGEAAQSVAQGIGSVAEARRAYDALNADTDARDALNRFMEADRHLRYNPEDGYLTRTGANALGARESYEEALRRSREQIASRLTPAARRAFDERADTIQNRSREQFIRHEAQQLREYTVEAGNASVQSFVDEALTAYDNPQLFEENLAEAIGEFNALAAKQGMSPEAASEARRGLASGVVRAAAMRMAGDRRNGGAQRALNFAQANAERMTAEDQYELEETLKPLRDEQMATEFVDRHTRPSSERVDRTAASRGSLPDDQFARYVEDAALAQRVGELSGDAYVQELFQIESRGGELTARNPYAGQTAAGPFQFTKDTWLRYFDSALEAGLLGEEMRGLSERERLELRTTSRPANNAVFTVFRRDNRDALRKNQRLSGDPSKFDPENPMHEHMLHWFGKEGGLRMLAADADTPVVQLIGRETARINGINGRKLTHMTVGEVRDASAQRFGVPTAPRAPHVQDLDLVSAYENIAELPPEARQHAMQQLSQLAKAQAQARGLDQEEAQREAFEQFEAGNLDPNNIPLEQRLRMGQSGVSAFQQAAQNRLQGVQHTDAEVLNTLLDASAENPREFKDVNLEAHRPHLTDADYTQLRGLQRDIRASMQEQAMQTAAERSNLQVKQAFDKTAPVFRDIVGYDPKNPDDRGYEAEQVLEYRRALSRRVEQYFAENERAPGELELQNMAFELLGTLESEGDELFQFDLNRVREPGADVRVPRVEYETMDADVAEALMLLVDSETPGMTRRDARQRVELLGTAYQIANGPDHIRGLIPEVDIDEVLMDPSMAEVVEEVTRTATQGRARDENVITEGYRIRVDDPGDRRAAGRDPYVYLDEQELTAYYGRMLVERMRNEEVTR